MLGLVIVSSSSLIAPLAKVAEVGVKLLAMVGGLGLAGAAVAVKVAEAVPPVRVWLSASPDTVPVVLA